MKKETIFGFTLLVSTFLLVFVIGETAVRFLGYTDANGNFIIFFRTLRPYQLPIYSVNQQIEAYQNSESFIIYDPVLGWVPNPDHTSQDGLITYNTVGIRSDGTEYSVTPADDRLRIGLYGDSFTHGDEVVFRETWGYYLEQNLRNMGIDVEVINFGVGGYAMDQSLLRWQTFGCMYQPDIVLFGLQMENIQRNVNLIRPFYYLQTSIPFSKPRFVLMEDDLMLVNVPTIPPEQLPAIVADMGNWEHAAYEHFFERRDYERGLIWRSRLIGFVYEMFHALADDQQYFYDPSEESTQVTLRILDTFQQDVKEMGGAFLLVHLPIMADVEDLTHERPLVYDALLDEMSQRYTLIETSAQMTTNESESLFATLHYAAQGNQAIVEAVTEQLLQNPIEGCTLTDMACWQQRREAHSSTATCPLHILEPEQ